MSDLLAHEDDVRIALNFFCESFIESFAVSECRHVGLAFERVEKVFSGFPGIGLVVPFPRYVREYLLGRRKWAVVREFD